MTKNRDDSRNTAFFIGWKSSVEAVNRYDILPCNAAKLSEYFKNFEWKETSDRAVEIYQSTLSDQTIHEVSILAEAAAVINDTLIHTQA